MKLKLKLQPRIASALLGLFVAASAGVALAQDIPTLWLNTFQTDLTGLGNIGGNMNASSNEFGVFTNYWSPVDCPGGTNTPSGSLYISVPWNVPTNNMWQWEEVQLPISVGGGIDASAWLAVEYDVKIDTTNSYTSIRSTNAYFNVNTVCQMWNAPTNTDWGWHGLGSTTLQKTNGWQHIKHSLLTFPTTMNNLVIILVGQTLTNKCSYFIDNIKLTAAPAPPPTMKLATIGSVPGLQIIAGPSGDYPRQNIRTYPTNEMTWVGRSGPVTYSMTFGNFPGTNYSGFQGHMMLVPNAGSENSPDWNQANAMCLFVTCMADGRGSGTLHYKTNSPGANSMMYQGPNTNGLPVGQPTNCVSSSPLGKWSLTFLNDTNITITGPDGTMANATLTPDEAALFGSGVIFYVGNQPNNAARNGQFTTLTAVDVTGTPFGPIHDTFTAYNANLWDNSTAASVQLINLITPNDRFNLTWTTPDNGFSELQTSGNLTTWTDSPLVTNAVLIGTTKQIRLISADLQGDQEYFRLLKRVATRLQILVPGETAAPGTPSGKTGVPIAQTNGVPFAIRINSCDNNWVVVASGGDQCQLTASGGFPAFTDANGYFNLASGTATQDVIFNDNGSFTITVTDIDKPGKTPATSSAITVNP